MANITKRTNKAGEVSYLIRAFVAWGADGKQITKSMTWKPPAGMKPRAAEKQAEKEAVLFEEKVKSGTVTLDGNIKFADYAAKWLEFTEMKPTTRFERARKLEIINQAIGHVPLEKLRAEHLYDFYKNLREDGVKKIKLIATSKLNLRLGEMKISLAAFAKLAEIDIGTLYNIRNGNTLYQETADKVCAAFESLGIDSEGLFATEKKSSKLSSHTIRGHHATIRAILNTAKKSRIINHAATDYMDAPKLEQKEARYLDDEQARNVLNALLDEKEDMRAKAALMILLFTGVRRGELCGLEWSDIDFEDNIIHVRRSSLYVPHQGIYESTTKTRDSARSITVTPIVTDILSEYREWQNDYKAKLGDSWKGEKQRLFTGEDGKPVYPVEIANWIGRFFKKNDLPYISPHGLRHTFITLQIAAGVDIRTLQARSGHSNPMVLLKVYSHSIQSAQAKAAQSMDNLLMPNVEQKLNKDE